VNLEAPSGFEPEMEVLQTLAGVYLLRTKLLQITAPTEVETIMASRSNLLECAATRS